jgi:23S rRNA (adenine2503-C2)-methyltransferase
MNSKQINEQVIEKINILELDYDELSKILAKNQFAKFRIKQIWNWLYIKLIQDFSEINNINKEEKLKLDNIFYIPKVEIIKDIKSSDETRKWLISFGNNQQIEMVFIPEEKRGTLCISSQIGCTLSCKFCHTGTQTLVRNLQTSEIINQVIVARNAINDRDKNKKIITNIVFMGMGEPFFNYDNIAKAIKVLNNQDGLDFSLRKITVSTSGLTPEIIKFSTEIKANLAISLHSTNDQERSEIMAINKKYPLDSLMKACKLYNNHNKEKKITFEYVMLKNVNDKDSNAKELINLINKYQINVKINLIPFNSWNGCGFQCSEHSQIIKFQNILKKSDLIATIRKTRGDNEMAACGQLKSESQRIANRLIKEITPN